MAAAQHTGVAQLRAEVIIPQVCVGVKMDDVQVGIFAHGCAHGTQSNKMLAAEQQRQLAVPQDLGRAGFNVHKGTFRRAEAELQIAAVKHIPIGQVLVLIGAVGLQTVAFVPHGSGAEPRAGTVTGGGIKRSAV